MRRIPMTAQEQLLLAHEHGHDLYLEQRGPWPEHGDLHPKFYVSCSCGYASAARRSRSAANSAMAWHLGRAIADILVDSPAPLPSTDVDEARHARGAGASSHRAATGT